MGLIKNIKSKIRGAEGEKKVKKTLNPLIFGRVYHKMINNFTLVDENGKSHQIDHIEIRSNGVFCIETKNYKGIITGGENSAKWMQHLYRDKHEFTNPLRQNKSHCFHLNKILDGRYKINSVVVMAQNNADSIHVDNVVNLSDLKKYLKNFDDGNYYSKDEIDNIYELLMVSKTKISNREHVENIKQTNKELKQGICPRCGAKLALRVGTHGDFYGCSNYPKCKFTINADKFDNL